MIPAILVLMVLSSLLVLVMVLIMGGRFAVMTIIIVVAFVFSVYSLVQFLHDLLLT